MKTINRICLLPAALVFVLLGSACLFTTALGPGFTAVKADGKTSLVYLYRPQHLVAGGRPVHVVVAGEERIVMIGGYAVMEVPEGKLPVLAYSTNSAQDYVTYGMGANAWNGLGSIDVAAGSVTFVRLTASIGPVEIETVSAETGRSEIGDLKLTPGGGLRTKVAQAPSPPTRAP